MNNNNQSNDTTNIVPVPTSPNTQVNQPVPETTNINNNNIVNSTPPTNVFNTQTVGTSSATTISKTEDEILKSPKVRKKWPHIVLLFLELIIIGGGVYLLIRSNQKYNTFTVVGADLYSSEKIYKAGKPYYTARYVYRVNDQKYYYNYPKDFEGKPDSIIQIKYNPNKPEQVYSSKETLIAIIIVASGTVFLFITICNLLSISSGKKVKIVTVAVEDIITCIGGRKIIMRNIDTPVDYNNPEKTEYYSYFTNQLQNFPIGRKLKFNATKYSEVLTTDKYKDKFDAMNINELKVDDFIIVG